MKDKETYICYIKNYSKEETNKSCKYIKLYKNIKKERKMV